LAMRYWDPAPGHRHDKQLAFLMNTAANGLAMEDKHLATRVTDGKGSRVRAMQPALGGVGPGPAYWLDETTLVYLNRRAWLDAGVSTALDWSRAQLEAGDPAIRNGRGKSHDLAVFCEKRPYLFEAKSWSYYSPRMVSSALAKDAQKLRAFAGAPYLKNPLKHILLFGNDHRGDKHNETLCVDAGLQFAGKATFPASTRYKVDDHFIITLFSVIP